MELNKEKRSDADLIRAFLSDRSDRNFVTIYHRYALTVYRLALHFVGYSEVLAKDVVQETWITVVQKLEKFENRSSFKTWLTGILINKCKELSKKEKLNDHGELSKAESYTINSSLPIALDLQAAINQLNPGYRSVLILHDAEDYTHLEIAALLEISEGTSKSQLFHARNQIRKYLNK